LVHSSWRVELIGRVGVAVPIDLLEGSPGDPFVLL